jgi:hypothetical protein
MWTGREFKKYITVRPVKAVSLLGRYCLINFDVNMALKRSAVSLAIKRK